MYSLRWSAIAAMTVLMLQGVGPLPAAPAEAFVNDVCRATVSVREPQRGSQRTARSAAVAAWIAAVRRHYGPRFTDWGYSGDRSFNCGWDRTGHIFQCRVTAIPCARGR